MEHEDNLYRIQDRLLSANECRSASRDCDWPADCMLDCPTCYNLTGLTCHFIQQPIEVHHD